MSLSGVALPRAADPNRTTDVTPRIPERRARTASIARHGRALLGDPPRFAVSDLDLQPLRLISYRLRRQSPARRARLLRLLDGYRTEKRVGRKRYRSEGKGLLEAVGGWRLGRGAIVVPEEAVESVDALLRRFGATRSIVAIWCQRP